MSKDNKTPSSSDYEVGYGRPPKHTRFSKGRSGNPAGRPRKQNDKPVGGRAMLAKKLNTPRGAIEGGVKVTRRMIDLLIDQHLNSFITGKVKSIKPLLELLRWYDSYIGDADVSSEGIDHGAIVRAKLDKLAAQLRE